MVIVFPTDEPPSFIDEDGSTTCRAPAAEPFNYFRVLALYAPADIAPRDDILDPALEPS